MQVRLERAKAITLALVGIAITVMVYGAVALIVKADDLGMALAQREQPLVRAIGRGLVRGMPGFLKALSIIGTLAMLWVGGGIILHGLAEFGLGGPEHALEVAGKTLGGGFVGWLVGASVSGLLGLALGAMMERAVRFARAG